MSSCSNLRMARPFDLETAAPASICNIVCCGRWQGNTLQSVNLLKHADYVMHDQQFNIQQLYAVPTLYLFVLYLSENKQRLVPLTA